MKKLIGFVVAILAALAFANTIVAFIPEAGTIIAGAAIDRATQTPLEGGNDLRVSLFDAEIGGVQLFEEAQLVPFSGGAFEIALQQPPLGGLPGDLYLEFGLNGEPAAPRLRLTLPSEFSTTFLDLLAFSRESPSSAISITARVIGIVPYDAVEITPRIFDQTGQLQFAGSPAIASADVNGVFTINLAAIPTAVLSQNVQRLLQLTLTATQGGAPVLAAEVYEMPLTFVSSSACIELLHLLPPGSPPPIVQGGSFGCPTAAPAPTPEPPPPDGDVSQLSQLVAQLESLVNSLQSQVASLEQQVATLQSRVVSLEQQVATLAHDDEVDD